MRIPESWQDVLAAEATADYFQELQQFLGDERAQYEVFPSEADVFAALRLTSLGDTRVVLLGQDPYHGDGQAHGLCFSVQPGAALPPSLKNIYRELRADVGCNTPQHGCLISWAKQGVLMVNTVLTVRAHQPHSHKKHGWERFTDAVIALVNSRSTPVIFVLWGRPAQAKKQLIDTAHHVVIESAHPSPLSARRGFFDSRPFSKINARDDVMHDPQVQAMQSLWEFEHPFAGTIRQARPPARAAESVAIFSSVRVSCM